MKFAVLLIPAFWLFAACDDGQEPSPPLTSLVELVDATSEQCPNGGTVIHSGVDANRDGALAPEEITATRTLCNGADGTNGIDGTDGTDGIDGTNGADGTDGYTSLIRTTAEPAGENCAEGGVKISHGIDDDRDGVLDEEEVDGFEYVCNGLPGTGQSSLVSIMDEAPGANCPHGGQGIRSGMDLNGDHLLQPAEVENTVYVCNGGDGATSLIRRADEPAGATCPAGGQAVMTGLDVDGDGYLDDVEVQTTYHVCHGEAGQDGVNGTDGTNGADGVNNLFETTIESPGTTCPAGGVWIISGPDTDHDGFLDADEIQVEQVLCHGVDGADGVDGTNGVDGQNGQDGQDGTALVLRATNAAWGGVCAYGGVRIETGLDLNANGVLDDDEVTQDHYVCNRYSGFTAVETGVYHTCAIRADGSLWCWGDNQYGQLGRDPNLSYSTPVPVPGMQSNVAAVTCGYGFTCALKTDGSMWCWGHNGHGQLGDNTDVWRHVPVQVTGFSGGITSIDCGSSHVCAIKDDESLWCWGYNYYGFLGNGTTDEAWLPILVTGMSSGVRAVDCSGHRTCAIKTDGSAWCWGANGAGQLGDGTTTNSYVPVPVTGMTSGVRQISAGGAQTCATKDDNSAWCWGGNNMGLHGDGTETGKLVPTPVPGYGTDIQSVHCSYSHTCFLKTDGSLWCSGSNWQGQLGIESPVYSLVPVNPRGLESDVTQVSCTIDSSCALRPNGTVWCWGNNQYGELGLGISYSGIGDTFIKIPTEIVGADGDLAP